MRLPAARRISRLEGVPKLDQKQDFRENKACHEIIHSFQQTYFFSLQRKCCKTNSNREQETQRKTNLCLLQFNMVGHTHATQRPCASSPFWYCIASFDMMSAFVELKGVQTPSLQTPPVTGSGWIAT